MRFGFGGSHVMHIVGDQQAEVVFLGPRKERFVDASQLRDTVFLQLNEKSLAANPFASFTLSAVLIASFLKWAMFSTAKFTAYRLWPAPFMEKAASGEGCTENKSGPFGPRQIWRTIAPETGIPQG